MLISKKKQTYELYFYYRSLDGSIREENNETATSNGTDWKRTISTGKRLPIAGVIIDRTFVNDKSGQTNLGLPTATTGSGIVEALFNSTWAPGNGN